MQDGSGLFEHIVTFNIKDTVSSYPRVGRGVNFIHRDICPLAFFFFLLKWRGKMGLVVEECTMPFMRVCNW